jgi:hypothetical protein
MATTAKRMLTEKQNNYKPMNEEEQQWMPAIIIG